MRVAILVLLIATVMMTSAPSGHGIPDKSPEAVARWFENLPSATRRLSRFHFFIHDVLSGPDQSIVTVAQPNVSFPNGFGTVNVVDELITVEADYNSGVFARSQGLIIIASKESLSYVDVLSVVFLSGEHSGSTLSVLGTVDMSEHYIEFPIVSGTGDFRLAEGIFTVNIYSVDPDTGNQAVEAHVNVLHYE